MIAKKFKLPIQDFIGQSGRIVKTPYFTLKVFSTNNAFSRFGVVISGKAVAKAVKRNALKRIIFDVFQKTFPKIEINDYLLVVAPNIINLDNTKLAHELKNLLSQFIKI